MGEYCFSEKLVLEETGDVFPCVVWPPPPQPKNEPSLEPPGDFKGDLCMVAAVSVESFENFRDLLLPRLILCGGVGFEENTDMLAEPGTVVVESLNHVPVDALAGVRDLDSLSICVCFSTSDVLDRDGACGVCGLSSGRDETRSGSLWFCFVKADNSLFVDLSSS